MKHNTLHWSTKKEGSFAYGIIVQGVGQFIGTLPVYVIKGQFRNLCLPIYVIKDKSRNLCSWPWPKFS